jgi:hypothetical protein
MILDNGFSNYAKTPNGRVDAGRAISFPLLPCLTLWRLRVQRFAPQTTLQVEFELGLMASSFRPLGRRLWEGRLPN